MVQQKKISIVQKLTDLLNKSQNFAIIKLGDPKHQSLETLRKQLKKVGASFRVIKNTLLEKTVNKLSGKNKIFITLKKDFFPLKNPSALLLLSNDWGKGLNAFYQFVKNEKSLSFKFGLLDGKTYKDEELLNIAKLPGKDQLIANIIASIRAPSSRLVHSMKFNFSELVYILKQKAKKTN